MNILVVCQYFWPEPFRVLDVCLGLQEKGHSITVLTGVPNYPEGRFYKGYGLFSPLKENHQGIEIIRIPLIPRLQGKGFQLVLNYFSFAVNALILAPFLCRGHFDIIFSYQLSPVTMALPAVLLRKLKKARLAHYVLDLWPESMAAAGGTGEGAAYRLMGRIVSYIYRKSDLILSSSQGFNQSIISRGANAAHVKYWPQWAEKIFMDVSGKKIEDSVFKTDAFKIVFAGNIGDAQGFGTLVEAAEILKNEGYDNIQWIILGDGRLRKWVEAEIEKRGLTEVFHLLGRKPVETMPSYYNLADALLVSLRDNELFALTLPAKIQSYLASGKPLIAAMNGEGARIVTESGAGLTCKAEDAEALSRLVLNISKKPVNELKDMGKKGKEYFDKNFSRDVLLEQLDQYLRNELV